MRYHLLASLKILGEKVDPTQIFEKDHREDEPGSPRIIKTPSKSPREKPRDKEIPDGAWKGDQVTPKQLAVLDKGKVEYWDGITKGEASELIDELFKERKGLYG